MDAEIGAPDGSSSGGGGGANGVSVGGPPQKGGDVEAGPVRGFRGLVRAERLEKTRKQFVTDKKLGNPVPANFREDDPWSCVFRALAQDDKFWAEQVVNPAVAWTAAGGKGSPVAAAEMIAGAHLPGVLHSDEGVDRKRQANRDKRAAKRKRIQNEREELNRLRGGQRHEEAKHDTKKLRRQGQVQRSDG